VPYAVIVCQLEAERDRLSRELNQLNYVLKTLGKSSEKRRDKLGSVGFFHAQGGFVHALAVGECGRGLWISPALLVPVGDMLAKHDQLDTRDRLVVIKTLEEDVCWRAA